MSEMRMLETAEVMDNAVAACGLKISTEPENVLAETTLCQTTRMRQKQLPRKRPSRKRKYLLTSLKRSVIKADTVGGLEALAFELDKMEIPIRMATVGPVNKRHNHSTALMMLSIKSS